MHFVRDVEYLSEYKLKLVFEDGVLKIADLKPHLDGEVFEPLKDADYFRKASSTLILTQLSGPMRLIFSPDFLYEIGKTSDMNIGSEKARAA